MKIALHTTLLVAALALQSAVPAVAASVFKGLDLNPTDSVPLTVHPNADAAQANFIAALSGAPTQQLDFEVLAAGSVPGTLSFNGALQASFTDFASYGSTIESGIAQTIDLNAPPARIPFFGFPISGSMSLASTTDAGESFWSMTFIQPLSALGFYLTDPSDWIGSAGPLPPIQIEVATSSGTTVYSLLPDGTDAANVVNASVGFFGVVDASGITGITILNPASVPGRDGVAFDDFIAVTAVPEPQTWMTMLSALGLLGIRLKRRAAAS